MAAQRQGNRKGLMKVITSIPEITTAIAANSNPSVKRISWRSASGDPAQARGVREAKPYGQGHKHTEYGKCRTGEATGRNEGDDAGAERHGQPAPRIGDCTCLHRFRLVVHSSSRRCLPVSVTKTSSRLACRVVSRASGNASCRVVSSTAGKATCTSLTARQYAS